MPEHKPELYEDEGETKDFIDELLEEIDSILEKERRRRIDTTYQATDTEETSTHTQRVVGGQIEEVNVGEEGGMKSMMRKLRKAEEKKEEKEEDEEEGGKEAEDEDVEKILKEAEEEFNKMKEAKKDKEKEAEKSYIDRIIDELIEKAEAEEEDEEEMEDEEDEEKEVKKARKKKGEEEEDVEDEEEEEEEEIEKAILDFQEHEYKFKKAVLKSILVILQELKEIKDLVSDVLNMPSTTRKSRFVDGRDYEKPALSKSDILRILTDLAVRGDMRISPQDIATIEATGYIPPHLRKLAEDIALKDKKEV